MLSLFQKLFGQSKAKAKAPTSTTHQHMEPTAPMPTVEVAHLRLSVILDRLPDELKSLVLAAPDEAVTVALPISTIVKQLPSGAVKVSLATLHRQAPAGILGPLPPGDKRMVDVPLAEVFRHIKPTVFKRRPDQKPADSVASEFNLFGDTQNPYQIAPTAPSDESGADLPFPATTPLPTPIPMPAARRPADLPRKTPLPASAVEFKLSTEPPAQQRTIAAPTDLFSKPTPAPPPTPLTPPVPDNAPPLSVPVQPLCGAWPEEIRNELAVLNGSAHVALPAAEVTAGLARGRVTFKWGQLRGWIEPALEGPSAADEATDLTLPLKVVAPLFLAATRKPKAEQKKSAFETDIPSLFSDGRPAPVEPEPVAEVAEPVQAEAIETVEAPGPVEPQPLTLQMPVAEPLTLQMPAAVEAPVVLEEPAAPPAPQSVGELFGEPDKAEWTPAELVSSLAKLPGISGAVVALQEGLLVAHSLPADVKSEVIAAFLPQLFARLNQYSSEMKLGEVDDLLFTTHGAHCQIYRLGYVYFGVLGKPGESLPWAELKLVADELSRQTQQKS